MSCKVSVEKDAEKLKRSTYEPTWSFVEWNLPRIEEDGSIASCIDGQKIRIDGTTAVQSIQVESLICLDRLRNSESHHLHTMLKYRIYQ